MYVSCLQANGHEVYQQTEQAKQGRTLTVSNQKMQMQYMLLR